MFDALTVFVVLFCSFIHSASLHEHKRIFCIRYLEVDFVRDIHNLLLKNMKRGARQHGQPFENQRAGFRAGPHAG